MLVCPETLNFFQKKPIDTHCKSYFSKSMDLLFLQCVFNILNTLKSIESMKVISFHPIGDFTASNLFNTLDCN